MLLNMTCTIYLITKLYRKEWVLLGLLERNRFWNTQKLGSVKVCYEEELNIRSRYVFNSDI